MSTTQDRDDVLLMARIAGLDLPPAFHDELIEAHAKLQSILARMPRDRDRGLPNRQRRSQTCSCLLQARQELARFVFICQKRRPSRGVDKHQAPLYKLSRDVF